VLSGPLSIIFLSAIFLGVFIILQRASIVDLLVGFICATLPLEWVVEVRGVNLSIYDLAFVLGVPIFGIIIVRHREYRNKQVYALLVLFMAFQIWNLIAQFAHESGRSIFQLVWSDYKNNFVGLIFLLTGIVLASRPQHIQRRLLWILLAAFGFEACVGIVQTATSGVQLNSNITGRYLGLLTVTPSQGVANSLIELQGDGSVDNGTFVGAIFRAVGTHGHSNFFAVSMIAGLALSMGVLSVRRYLWLHWWGISVGCVLLVALALSFTRTGYLAFIAMCIWQFVFWKTATARWRTTMLVFTVTLILVLILILAPVNEIRIFVTTRLGSEVLVRIQNILQPNQAGEFSFRTSLWAFALDRVQSSPWFGVAQPITLRDIIPTLAVPERSLPLHNQIVSSIYYGGYIAGGLYVIIHLWLIWISRKLYPQIKEIPVFSMWVIAANLCFVGLAIESLTIDWMPFTSLQGVFWLMAGIIVMQYCTIAIAERTPATLNTRSRAIPLVS
jgi:O-antigen ligase